MFNSKFCINEYFDYNLKDFMAIFQIISYNIFTYYIHCIRIDHFLDVHDVLIFYNLKHINTIIDFFNNFFIMNYFKKITLNI
jgi:hypothetical protein